MELEYKESMVYIKLMICTLVMSAVFALNCSSEMYGVSDPTPESAARVVESTPPATSSHNSVLSADEIAELKKYAENYQPRSGREVIPSPPNPPENILTIIAKAAAANSREHEKFVMLIFVRLARFQVENFRQSYELGRTNPLTIEFYRLIGRDDFASQERNGAFLAGAHVENNPELRQYALIDAEMRRIAKMSERIENDLNKPKAKTRP